MDKDLMARARRRAEHDAGGPEGLSERDRELLDIGIRPGFTETMELLRRRFG